MKQINVKEQAQRQAEAALNSKGHNVTVLWSTAYPSSSNNTRVFVKCNLCGSTKDFQVGNLRIGKYKCEHCLLDKYSQSCNNLNLKLLEKFYEKEQLRLLVECKICGERSKVGTGHVINSSFRCTGCLIEKYKKACEFLNLNFVEKTIINGFTKIITRCKTCNNEAISSNGDILKGKFKCNNCTINKYKACIERKNCNFVSFEKRYKQRSIINYTNSNGDCFKASACNVLEGKFETSLNGYWSQYHSVYLIKLQVNDSSFICKIGTANDPNKRAKDLKLSKDYQVFTLASFDTRVEADRLEKEFHKKFSPYRLPSIEVEEYTWKFKSCKRSDGSRKKVKDGITEWFSSEVYETLKVRYNLT